MIPDLITLSHFGFLRAIWIGKNHIKVHLDNEEIIQGTIPDYNFKGGLIGFSGTTGACTNFHRIDNLRHQPHCSFD